MNKQSWMIALTGLVVLLVGCGTSGTETEQSAQMIPSPVTEDPMPTDTPLPAATSTVPPTPVVVRSAADVQRITPDEARPLLDDGLAVLYDVRSEGAYRGQHAAGAVSFPEAEVVTRFSELPADEALIFY